RRSPPCGRPDFMSPAWRAPTASRVIQEQVMDINDKTGSTRWLANPERYARMRYRPAGASGLRLPAISLGLWHNFGFVDDLHTARAILRTAFDLGIVHWNAANNYGPPYGSA